MTVKEIAFLIKELESQLGKCMRCGMCQAVCPLFEQTSHEADVARGKLALLDGLIQEMFETPDRVYKSLNKCLTCGSCEANCPSGVNILEIFIKAKAILTGYMGFSLIKKIALRRMLAYPKTLNILLKFVDMFQRNFVKQASKVVGIPCARIDLPFFGRRHFVTMVSEPFHNIVSFLNTPRGNSNIKVAFYVGCLIDKFFPSVAQSAVDILNHYGVGIYIPENQACCGMPAISLGDIETFNQLLHNNLDKFEKEEFDYLITSCATCTFTIKKIWNMMVKDDSKKTKIRVKELADKTLDIHQFIVSKLGVLMPSNSSKQANLNSEQTRIITYHDPCHLKKSLGVYYETRALIKANDRFCFVEMPDSDRCCGMGGSFNIRYYDISAAIGKLKRNNIVASKCVTVATACPACMMQLSDMLSRAGDKIEVKHSIEIYAQSLKRRYSTYTS
mmetsp:Transcript_23705/g.11410  ORF Transcript_23705/g.11410 Transcript_23705/m.11410 type:complete len:446 (-) Transcript_23705:1265-2602(-)